MLRRDELSTLTDVSKNRGAFIPRVSQSIEKIYREGEALHSFEMTLKILPNDTTERSAIIRPSIAMLLKAFFQKVWCHNTLIIYRPSPLTSLISRYIFTLKLLRISQNLRRDKRRS